jgi:hypothetical protein
MRSHRKRTYKKKFRKTIKKNIRRQKGGGFLDFFNKRNDLGTFLQENNKNLLNTANTIISAGIPEDNIAAQSWMSNPSEWRANQQRKAIIADDLLLNFKTDLNLRDTTIQEALINKSGEEQRKIIDSAQLDKLNSELNDAFKTARWGSPQNFINVVEAFLDGRLYDLSTFLMPSTESDWEAYKQNKITPPRRAPPMQFPLLQLPSLQAPSMLPVMAVSNQERINNIDRQIEDLNTRITALQAEKDVLSQSL